MVLLPWFVLSAVRTPQRCRLMLPFSLPGRIRAIQLNYTEAHANLQQAIRRAPEAKAAPGFVQTAQKLSIVVELLMGEIPERRIFREPVLKKALIPYLEIAQGKLPRTVREA